MSELIKQVLRASQHRFIGRMARDPELRSFDSGNCVCNSAFDLDDDEEAPF
jgi:single-stranded DNA-binding protein